MPNLVDYENPEIISWLKSQKDSENLYLSICEGAKISAKTGLFHNRELTSHSSALSKLKKDFDQPLWIENVRFTQDGTMLSTAGVSSAVEGSLIALEALLGTDEKLQAMARIGYPSSVIEKRFNGKAIGFGDKFSIGKKVFFGENKRIGVVLTDGVGEIEIAAILDAYNRTFPAAIETFTKNKPVVLSRNGLQLIPSQGKHAP